MQRGGWNTKNRFLLLYGSQTGQAKAIAEEIADTAPQFGLKADLHCLSLTEKKFCIDQESCVVLVVSTTGDGEPPDTGLKFFRRISKRTLDLTFLKNVRYALLALGDSNYSTFCQFGKQLEKVLKSLSAKPFYETGYADDATGIETVADPWLANLFPAIRQLLGLSTECTSKSSLTNNCHHLSDSVLEFILSVNQVHKTGQLNRLVKSSDLINMSAIQNEENSRNDSIYSLSLAVDMLKAKELRIPPLPPAFLSVTYSDQQKENYSRNVEHTEGTSLVSAASALVNVRLKSAKRLTESADVKETLEITFKFTGENVPYQPGDSFGFICKNPEEEVTALLERLGVLDQCNKLCKLSIAKEHSSKKKSVLHLPESSTLKQIFSSHCDMRSVPKKILLRILLEYATDETDQLCLRLLCSQEGAPLFTEYIRKPSLCLLDILHAFKSCTPPVERILEYIPVLKPRFYSVTSSPLVDSSLFRVVFNVVRINEGSGRYQARKGICTGWLSEMAQKLKAFQEPESDVHEISYHLSSLSLNSENENFHVYKRQNRFFLLPSDLSIPVIMIGPGTGVAPFVGFLQHREQQVKNSTCTYGETWLFFGCRYQKKDFIYREELTRLHSHNMLTHLITCFSRDEPELSEITPLRYVQDSMKRHAEDIVRLIDNGGRIYVCGDAKHMAQDVFQAFVDIIETVKNVSRTEAMTLVKNLEAEKRYVADVWT